MQRDECRHQCRDRHQQRNRDAEGSRQRVRRAEADHGRKGRESERPIHYRDIDLTDLVTGGVDDVHARQKAELNGLLGERIGAGDDRLGGDDGRDSRKDDQTIVRPFRGKLIEGVVDGTGLRAAGLLAQNN